MDPQNFGGRKKMKKKKTLTISPQLPSPPVPSMSRPQPVFKPLTTRPPTPIREAQQKPRKDLHDSDLPIPHLPGPKVMNRSSSVPFSLSLRASPAPLVPPPPSVVSASIPNLSIGVPAQTAAPLASGNVGSDSGIIVVDLDLSPARMEKESAEALKSDPDSVVVVIDSEEEDEEDLDEIVDSEEDDEELVESTPARSSSDGQAFREDVQHSSAEEEEEEEGELRWHDVDWPADEQEFVNLLEPFPAIPDSLVKGRVFSCVLQMSFAQSERHPEIRRAPAFVWGQIKTYIQKYCLNSVFAGLPAVKTPLEHRAGKCVRELATRGSHIFGVGLLRSERGEYSCPNYPARYLLEQAKKGAKLRQHASPVAVNSSVRPVPRPRKKRKAPQPKSPRRKRKRSSDDSERPRKRRKIRPETFPFDASDLFCQCLPLIAQQPVAVRKEIMQCSSPELILDKLQALSPPESHLHWLLFRRSLGTLSSEADLGDALKRMPGTTSLGPGAFVGESENDVLSEKLVYEAARKTVSDSVADQILGLRVVADRRPVFDQQALDQDFQQKVVPPLREYVRKMVDHCTLVSGTPESSEDL